MTPSETINVPDSDEVVDLGMVDALIQSAINARTTKQRRQLMNTLTTQRQLLRTVSDDLYRKLDSGWDHLQPTGDDPNRSTWEQWLVDYEAVQDRIHAIDFQVFAESPELVRSRNAWIGDLGKAPAWRVA